VGFDIVLSEVEILNVKPLYKALLEFIEKNLEA